MDSMKQIILSVMLMAFAVAVNAADDKACSDKEKAACCEKAKAGEMGKGECPMKKDKAACPITGKTAEKGKDPLKSPKAEK